MNSPSYDEIIEKHDTSINTKLGDSRWKIILSDAFITIIAFCGLYGLYYYPDSMFKILNG